MQQIRENKANHTGEEPYISRKRCLQFRVLRICERKIQIREKDTHLQGKETYKYGKEMRRKYPDL